MSQGYMRQCAGKIRHETKSEAMAKRAALTGANGARRDSMHAYKCTQCLGWHVGHAGRLYPSKATKKSREARHKR